MSRALDAETKRLLSKGDASAAFRAISQALRPLESGDVREIEILWLGYQFDEGACLVEDGRAVGISKLALVQAFFFAHRILSRHLAERAASDDTTTATISAGDGDSYGDGDGGHDGDAAYDDDDQLLLDATAVMLLLDAAHLTAANARKRILQRQVRQLDGVHGHEDEAKRPGVDAAPGLALLIRRERQVVDGLLTSRLHRHTKSPTLWSHRWWLLTLAESLGLGLGSSRAGAGIGGGARREGRKVQAREVLGEMREVVVIAADRHPRNYYAWGHARFLVGFLFDRLEGEGGGLREEREHGSGNEGDGDNKSGEGEGAEGIDAILRLVTDWCVQHHNDTSGWSFLYFLLSQLRGQSPSPSPPPPLAEKAAGSYADATFQGVLDLTRMMSWANESVWVFLAMLVGDGLVGERGRAQLLHVGRDLLESLSGDIVAKSVLERWIGRCQQAGPSADQHKEGSTGTDEAQESELT